MERPDQSIGKTTAMALVARTQSIEEAERVAEEYELKGYKTTIVKRSRTGMNLYEVWAGKEPDVFSGRSA